jgi:hypothetical protein
MKQIPPFGRNDNGLEQRIPPFGRNDNGLGQRIPPFGRNDNGFWDSRFLPLVGMKIVLGQQIPPSVGMTMVFGTADSSLWSE